MNTKAGVAGSGAGTIFLAIADKLPAEWGAIKQIAIYLCPLSAVVVVGMWIVIGTQLRRWKRRSDMNKLLADARSIREAVLANPTSSKAHKEKVCRNVEEFETLSLKLLEHEAAKVSAHLTPHPEPLET